jgi:hypothetical protein
MAFIPDRTAVTSKSTYEVGMCVSVTNNDADHQNSNVVITPYLRNIEGVERKQHNWTLTFKIDGIAYPVYYNGAAGSDWVLPNRASGTIKSNGAMDMAARQWYQWGFQHTATVPNDGRQHTFELVMNCIGTVPYNCPAEGTLSMTVTTAVYRVNPPAPKGVDAIVDTATQEIEYVWTDADCAFVYLWRNYYDASGKLLTAGYFTINRPNGECLYNADVHAHLIKEKLPKGTVLVTWEVVNYSATSHPAASGEHRKSIETDCKVWVKIGNDWKKAIPWVKTSNGWKKASKAYVKVGNDWKRTVM